MMNREADVWGDSPLRLTVIEQKILKNILSNNLGVKVSNINHLTKGHSGAQIFRFEAFGKNKVIKLMPKKRCLREFSGNMHFSSDTGEIKRISIPQIIRPYEVEGLILNYYSGIELRDSLSKNMHNIFCNIFDDLFIGSESHNKNPKIALFRYFSTTTEGFRKLGFTHEEEKKIANLISLLIRNNDRIYKVHGDPSLGNILYNKGEFIAIDYGNFSVLPKLTQRSRFLNSLIISGKESTCKKCNRCEEELHSPTIMSYRVCDLIRRMKSDFYNKDKVMIERRLCKKILTNLEL